MKRIFNTALIVSLFLSVCCQRKLCKRDELKCLNTSFLWEIIGSDSTYYEFYFDNNMILYYEEGVGGVYPCMKDSSVYYNFLDVFFSSSNSHEQSESVGDFFITICRPRVIIKSIKPIGNFLYHFSNDPHNNYILFNNEASDRYFKYKGYNVENETPDSFFEVITIPKK